MVTNGSPCGATIKYSTHIALPFSILVTEESYPSNRPVTQYYPIDIEDIPYRIGLP